MALSVGYLDLPGHVLVVLLRCCRPPGWGDQVTEHLVYRHPGNGQAEGKYVLISQPGLGGQVPDVRWRVERPVKLHLHLARVVLAVAPQALVIGRDEVRAPVWGEQPVLVLIRYDVYPAFENRDQVAVGDVIQNVSGHRSVNTAEEHIAIQCLFVRGAFMHGGGE